MHAFAGETGEAGQPTASAHAEARQTLLRQLPFPDPSGQPSTPLSGTDGLPGPVQFTLKLLGFWRLGREDATRLLGFEDTEAKLVSHVLAGQARFPGRDARDRIAHLLHIRSTLSALFRDLDVENEWLREPHTLLGGQSPLALMLGGSMEDLLLVRDYTDAAAGR